MGTIFAPINTNLTIEYQEIKVYSIIHQSYALANKYFDNFWFRFFGNCQILQKVNLIKPDNSRSILNQINDSIQFTMEKRLTRIFLDIVINESGTKIWMDIYNKPKDSKRYVSFTPKYPRRCLTIIPFSLIRGIYTIVENENVTKKMLQRTETKDITRTIIFQVTNRSYHIES